ncbi:hypothetical protein PR048_029442 [Dryococelus australis]|uniref:Reverse transcriptase domain-containing protein n=1 Tax=Dryococelus australis TaxID=614101 RepID=A0ABQ9GDD1_9NEOP|nr:hypothetical protein PR048_029442 [Dryococelus australis]
MLQETECLENMLLVNRVGKTSREVFGRLSGGGSDAVGPLPPGSRAPAHAKDVGSRISSITRTRCATVCRLEASVTCIAEMLFDQLTHVTLQMCYRLLIGGERIMYRRNALRSTNARYSTDVLPVICIAEMLFDQLTHVTLQMCYRLLIGGERNMYRRNALRSTNARYSTDVLPCASKDKKRGSDTGDTNTHAQRLIAPTRKACSVAVLKLEVSKEQWRNAKGRGKRKVPEETRQPASSSGTIPTWRGPSKLSREKKRVRMIQRRSDVRGPRRISPWDAHTPHLGIMGARSLEDARCSADATVKILATKPEQYMHIPERERSGTWHQDRKSGTNTRILVRLATLNHQKPVSRRGGGGRSVAVSSFWNLRGHRLFQMRGRHVDKIGGPRMPPDGKWAAVTERYACSPPTEANRVQSRVGSLSDFRRWESCRTIPLVGGFSPGSPVSPARSFRRCSILTSITLIGSQDLAVKNRPSLFTHSRTIPDTRRSECLNAKLESQVVQSPLRSECYVAFTCAFKTSFEQQSAFLHDNFEGMGLSHACFRWLAKSGAVSRSNAKANNAFRNRRRRYRSLRSFRTKRANFFTLRGKIRNKGLEFLNVVGQECNVICESQMGLPCFSTIDHILAQRELISLTNEYHMPLCVAFVDFENVFDSVNHKAVLQALTKHGVGMAYIRVLHYIYDTFSAFVSVSEPTTDFRIEIYTFNVIEITLKERCFSSTVSGIVQMGQRRNAKVGETGENPEKTHRPVASSSTIPTNNTNTTNITLTPIQHNTDIKTTRTSQTNISPMTPQGKTMGRMRCPRAGFYCISGLTPYAYKDRKSCKETCITAERDWAAMACDWGHDYLFKGEEGMVNQKEGRLAKGKRRTEEKDYDVGITVLGAIAWTWSDTIASADGSRRRIAARRGKPLTPSTQHIGRWLREERSTQVQGGRGGVVVRLLASNEANLCFLGDLPYIPPLHSDFALLSPRFTLIGSQDHDSKSRPELSSLHTTSEQPWALVYNVTVQRPAALSAHLKPRQSLAEPSATVGQAAMKAEGRHYRTRTRNTFGASDSACNWTPRGGHLPRRDARLLPPTGKDRTISNGSFQDKIEVQHLYTEVEFVTGTQFIRHALDDSETIADLQGNNYVWFPAPTSLVSSPGGGRPLEKQGGVAFGRYARLETPVCPTPELRHRMYTLCDENTASQFSAMRSRGDGALDTCGSVAFIVPALVGLKRGKQFRVDGILKGTMYLRVQGQEARERYGRHLTRTPSASSLLRARRAVFPSAGMRGRGGKNGRFSKETSRLAASSGTSPTCGNSGATPPGIESGLHKREASSLTTTPPPLPGLPDERVAIIFLKACQALAEQTDGTLRSNRLIGGRMLDGRTTNAGRTNVKACQASAEQTDGTLRSNRLIGGRMLDGRTLKLARLRLNRRLRKFTDKRLQCTQYNRSSEPIACLTGADTSIEALLPILHLEESLQWERKKYVSKCAYETDDFIRKQEQGELATTTDAKTNNQRAPLEALIEVHKVNGPVKYENAVTSRQQPMAIDKRLLGAYSIEVYRHIPLRCLARREMGQQRENEGDVLLRTCKIRVIISGQTRLQTIVLLSLDNSLFGNTLDGFGPIASNQRKAGPVTFQPSQKCKWICTAAEANEEMPLTCSNEATGTKGIQLNKARPVTENNTHFGSMRPKNVTGFYVISRDPESFADSFGNKLNSTIIISVIEHKLVVHWLLLQFNTTPGAPQDSVLIFLAGSSLVPSHKTMKKKGDSINSECSKANGVLPGVECELISSLPLRNMIPQRSAANRLWHFFHSLTEKTLLDYRVVENTIVELPLVTQTPSAHANEMTSLASNMKENRTRRHASRQGGIGATTTSLSVLGDGLNYEEQGNYRQEIRNNPCDRELIGLDMLVERGREAPDNKLAEKFHSQTGSLALRTERGVAMVELCSGIM